MQNPTLLRTAPEEEVSLPRSLAFYEAQADSVHGQGPLEDAVGEVLHSLILTPRRYAELMRLIDTWVVEDHMSFADSCFGG